MEKKDYYDILGVSKDASDDEIKKAYRKLAREWHPDVAKDKSNAEEKFKEINESYQVLSDKDKRSNYDKFGTADFSGGSYGSGAGQGPFGAQNYGPFTWTYSASDYNNNFEDPFDIFEQVFGFRGFGSSRKGRNLNYTLPIDFENSITGLEKTVEVDGHKLKIKLPPGVEDGARIKYAGKGENPGGNVPPGDLFIIVDVRPDKKFVRQGNDIFTVEEIPMKTAVLGGIIPIKVVDPDSPSGFSEKKLKIPSGTQPGSQIRVRGQGMPNRKGYGRGNHYVTINVKIPQKLNSDQKRALEEYFD